jgi:hypothetical protein
VTEVNGLGDVAELALIEGPGVTSVDDLVLLVAGEGGLHYVLGREGDEAVDAGPGVYFSSLSTCLLDNHGEAFYLAQLGGEGVTPENQWAVYFGPYVAPRLSMRGRSPAPTFGRGVFVTNPPHPALAAMNDAGDIVGATLISGPGVTENDNVALWMRHHLLQTWAPLLRSGSELEGRTIYAASAMDLARYCPGTGGADGRPQSLNDDGMLVLTVPFADGTFGHFRIHLPVVAGDGDGDGDVDVDDWILMQECWDSDTDGMPPDCPIFDLDSDGDIDLADQAVFQRLFR